MSVANPQFESAADAVVAGDAAALKLLFEANPQLIRARSTRPHRATLLHYVAANGVEEERQRTPANIVEIAELLLRSGAEVDAEADVYGGGATTLGLAATSIHPQVAGVQIALLEKLLEHGASLNPKTNAIRPQSLVEACLANGRKDAAEFLRSRGAPITLAAAAGLGELDTLRNYFAPGLASSPSQAELQQGFFFACEYGRRDSAEFLLDRGANVGAANPNGQTALHCAIIGGSVEMVRWILTKNPPLAARNAYGGTPFGQAQWSRDHCGDPETYAMIINLLEAVSS